jgi:hypothetical protein
MDVEQLAWMARKRIAETRMTIGFVRCTTSRGGCACQARRLGKKSASRQQLPQVFGVPRNRGICQARDSIGARMTLYKNDICW